MSSYLLVIPLIFLVFYLSLIYESTGFALLGFTAAVFAVLSFLYMLFMRNSVKVKLEIPLKIVEKGQSFSLRLQTKKLNTWPIGKVVVIITYGERAEINYRDTAVEMNGSEENGEESRKICIQSAGCYDFYVRKIKIYDPFGIFHVSRKEILGTQVMVMPELREIPVRLGEGVKHFYGETVEYDDLLAGQDASEVFDIREYRDGDKLQRIHWKLSARTNEWMVKENSLPKACAILLFMPEGKLGENLNYMASLSFTLTDAKCAHYIVWRSRTRGDLVRIRVCEEESFYLALTAFLQDRDGESGGDRLERYREKYKGEQFLHSVCADENGFIQVDDGEPFRAEGYEEELILK